MIIYKGKRYTSEDKLLKSTNRAFKYGDGLFESIRAFDGCMPFWAYHKARLQRGMEILQMDHANFDLEQVKTALQALLLEGPNARIRLTIFREDGGLYSPTSNQADYILEVQALENNHFEWNEDGLNLGLCDTVSIDAKSPFSNLKTVNSLPYVLAGIFRSKNNFDECFLLNHEGFIAEASYSNLFIVKNMTIYTPLLSDGGIDGCLRLFLINLIQEAGLEIYQDSIPPEALLEADEVFLTNAIRGIQWVNKYEEKLYTNTMSRFLFKKLNQFVAHSLKQLSGADL